MKNILKLIPVLFILASCQPAPAPLNYPPLRFTDRTPITLDVSEIQVMDAYKPPMVAPNVDHIFPVTLQSALHQWADDRLRAAGKDKQLQFIIKDASAVREKLPVTTGIKGALTNDQAERITAKVSVELRIYGDQAISLASTEINAMRSTTIGEKASLATRDQTYYNLTKQLMADVNAELEKNIQQYFSNYIRYNY